MELLYEWLRAAGYPEEAIDWVRRRQGWVILGLAILAWLPIIGLGWLIWVLLP
jgi:hypothetical protein